MDRILDRLLYQNDSEEPEVLSVTTKKITFATNFL